MAVRTPPTCRKPVGEGAKRTRTGPRISMLIGPKRYHAPAGPRKIYSAHGTPLEARNSDDASPAPHDPRGDRFLRHRRRGAGLGRRAGAPAGRAHRAGPRSDDPAVRAGLRPARAAVLR